MYTQLSLLLPHDTMVRSHMLSARAEPGPPSSQSASDAQLHVSMAHMGGGGGKRGPQSAQSPVCILGAGAAVVGEGERSRCRDAPVGAPPEGNAKDVTRSRRRVTTATSRDDSVVAHGSLPAAWSDSGVTVAERWPW